MLGKRVRTLGCYNCISTWEPETPGMCPAAHCPFLTVVSFRPEGGGQVRKQSTHVQALKAQLPMQEQCAP